MNDYQRRTLMLAIVAVGVPCAGFIIALAWTGADFVAVSECGQSVDAGLNEFRESADAERLIGQTRAEVIASIGEPTSTRFAPEWDMSYRLRTQGFCVDSWYLVLNTSSDGVVTDAAILGD